MHAGTSDASLLVHGHSAQTQVQAAIDASMKGRTVVIIAHRLSTVRRAHKIVVMSNGSVIEEGSHETLLVRDGAYSKLVSKQLEQHASHQDPAVSADDDTPARRGGSGGGFRFKTPEPENVRDRERERAVRAHSVAFGAELAPGCGAGRGGQGVKDVEGGGPGMHHARSPGCTCGVFVKTLHVCVCARARARAYVHILCVRVRWIRALTGEGGAQTDFRRGLLCLQCVLSPDPPLRLPSSVLGLVQQGTA